MFSIRTFASISGSALCSALLILAGCSQPLPPAPPAESPAPAASETVEGPSEPATSESVEVPAEPATPTPTADSTGTPTAPAAEASAEDVKLPEVLAVNTAQLGGLLEKTVGKVTVLNFWATWCLPCVQEMPDLVKFYDEMDRESVAFVSLSIDEVAEITGAIPEFQRAHKVSFPIYVLNERDDEAMEKALRGKFLGMIPATFIYDKSGKLAKMHEGPITQAALQEIVDPLLIEKP